MCGKRLLFSVLEISVMKKEEKVTKRSVLKSGFAMPVSKVTLEAITRLIKLSTSTTASKPVIV